MTEMDKKVLAFLKEWLAWAEDGGPEHEFFSGKSGLLFNALCYEEGRPNFAFSFLARQFGRRTAPFGWEDYKVRRRAGTMHQCPKRLAWVRAKIAELEEMDCATS